MIQNKGFYKWLPFIIFSGLFFLLNCRNLGGGFYWDEAVYANISEHLLYSDYYNPAYRVFTRHPPLYFLFLSLISNIPFQKEIVFRTFSVIFSIIGTGFLYYLFLSMKRFKLGVVFLALLVMNTLFQQYSQSATMYAMLFMFFSVFIAGVVEKNENLELVGMIGGIYTHYLMFVSLLIVVLLDYFLNKKRISPGLKRKLIIIAVSYLPWLLFFFPGFFYHAKKYSEFTAHINLYQFLWTFGITGLIAISFWAYRIFKERAKCLENRDNEIRFVVLATIFIIVHLALYLFGTPFLRYLFFILPLVYAVTLLSVARFLEHKKYSSILKKNGLFFILLLMMFVPNLKMLGVFPYSFSYHDNHDSIYNSYWDEIINDVHGSTVSVENVRSFVYYANKKYPGKYNTIFPWDALGVVELKYNPNNNENNIKNLEKISTTFVCIDSVGRYKSEMIAHLNNSGYKECKRYGSWILLKNEI